MRFLTCGRAVTRLHEQANGICLINSAQLHRPPKTVRCIAPTWTRSGDNGYPAPGGDFCQRHSWSAASAAVTRHHPPLKEPLLAATGVWQRRRQSASGTSRFSARFCRLVIRICARSWVALFVVAAAKLRVEVYLYYLHKLLRTWQR